MVHRGGGSSSIVEEHPYILCGHINLHHSDACNAQLVKYVNDAMRQCVFDGNGFTAEPGYRFNRAERPVNVRQWEERQRGSRAGEGTPQPASPQSDGPGLLQSGGGSVDLDSSSPGSSASPGVRTPLNPAEDPNFQGQLDDLIQGIRAQGTGATEERATPRVVLFLQSKNRMLRIKNLRISTAVSISLIRMLKMLGLHWSCQGILTAGQFRNT